MIMVLTPDQRTGFSSACVKDKGFYGYFQWPRILADPFYTAQDPILNYTYQGIPA